MAANWTTVRELLLPLGDRRDALANSPMVSTVPPRVDAIQAGPYPLVKVNA
jgi:hypothetical protein